MKTRREGGGSENGLQWVVKTRREGVGSEKMENLIKERASHGTRIHILYLLSHN